MKAKLVCLSALLSVTVGFSQNTFPTGIGTNVGIGTITPTERLEVTGTIKAKTGIFYNEVPDGAVFADYQERSLQCNVISAGAMLDSSWNYRTFQFWDFPQSNLDPDPTITFNLEDRNYKSRFLFAAASNSYSQLLLRDRNQNEVFKLYEDGSDNLWIHLPKSNSRLIIGGWANYAPGLAHKLVVQDGSALIEGNILTNSNVGIGTATPTERLEVIGTVKAQTGIFYNEVPNGASFADYQQRALQCNVLSAGAMLDSTWNYRTFQFWDFPQSNLDANPTITFNLEDRNYKSRFLFAAASNSYSQLLLRDRNQNEVFKLYEDGSDNLWIHLPKSNSRLIIGGWANYAPGLAHKLVVQDGSALIEGNILTNSNIGIGTGNFTDGADTFRLSVNGAIRANRVRVYTNWADYVFEENYKLPTLKQVEEYINEKGHLINIPSAREVEENGIDLGEMNKLLLEKIEEMTLYMIEMNKEIQDLKAELKTK